MIPDPTSLAVLGQAVQQLREDQDLNSLDLAAATGLHPDRIKAIERGEHDPPYDELLALADGLGVSVSTLFDRAETSGSGMSPSTRSAAPR